MIIHLLPTRLFSSDENKSNFEMLHWLFFERIVSSEYGTIFMGKYSFLLIQNDKIILKINYMDEVSQSTQNPENKSDKLPQLDKTSKYLQSRYMEKPWGFSNARLKKKDEQRKMRNKEI